MGIALEGITFKVSLGKPSTSPTKEDPSLTPSWGGVQGGGIEGLREKAGDSGVFGKLGRGWGALGGMTEAIGSWRGERKSGKVPERTERAFTRDIREENRGGNAWK